MLFVFERHKCLNVNVRLFHFTLFAEKMQISNFDKMLSIYPPCRAVTQAIKKCQKNRKIAGFGFLGNRCCKNRSGNRRPWKNAKCSRFFLVEKHFHEITAPVNFTLTLFFQKRVFFTDGFVHEWMQT